MAWPATRIRAPAATTRGAVLQVDAAVDFDGRRRVAGAIERSADLSDLRLAPRNEALAAEARVHRHHQHEVHIAGDLFERDDRRRWIEHDPGFDAERLDGVNRAVQMGQDFDVDRDHRGAGAREGVDVAVRVGDHQVHIERHVRDALQRSHDRRADGDVRDEVSVHHVDVNEIGAAAFGGSHRLTERGEIGGEDRRSDLHGHRLTSIEIGSPGPI